MFRYSIGAHWFDFFCKCGTNLLLRLSIKCNPKNIVEQYNEVISAKSNVIRTIFEVRLPKEKSSKI